MKSVINSLDFDSLKAKELANFINLIASYFPARERGQWGKVSVEEENSLYLWTSFDLLWFLAVYTF